MEIKSIPELKRGPTPIPDYMHEPIDFYDSASIFENAPTIIHWAHPDWSREWLDALLSSFTMEQQLEPFDFVVLLPSQIVRHQNI